LSPLYSAGNGFPQRGKYYSVRQFGFPQRAKHPKIFHTCDFYAPAIVARATKFDRMTNHDNKMNFSGSSLPIKRGLWSQNHTVQKSYSHAKHWT